MISLNIKLKLLRKIKTHRLNHFRIKNILLVEVHKLSRLVMSLSIHTKPVIDLNNEDMAFNLMTNGCTQRTASCIKG